MKNSILTALMILNIVLSFSQNFQGIAIYESHKHLDLKLDSTKYNLDTRSKIQRIFEKQFQKTYRLSFNSTESNYLEQKNSSSVGEITGSANFSSENLDNLYKNLIEQRYSNKKDFLGKVFLIKDSIKKYNWKLEKEIKNIGVYKCYKATCTIKNRSVKIEKDSIKIVAWYTTDIPIGNGPLNFDGLPGLILEVNDGIYTIICSKIIINPEQGIKIREPKGGKKISQIEFDIIEKKKQKEGLQRATDYLRSFESQKTKGNN